MKEPPIVCKPSLLPGPLSHPRPYPQRPPKQSRWRGFLDSRPAMFALLFGVTGFLGIPFLWMSEKFSHTEKIVWSIVVTLYTLILIGVAVAVCWWSYSQISQLFENGSMNL